MKVAALYVAANSVYSSIDGVECWDIERDARTYAGPHPVVAHPPCGRWCQLAGLVEARWGHKKGEDGGLFKRALEQVRTYGGVLEHPAYSAAWPRFGLPRPPRARDGWQRGLCGGWSCYVEQSRYGHPARKGTYLYAFGCDPPPLRWGYDRGSSRALVSWCANSTREDDDRPRLSSGVAAATPPAFALELVGIAASVPSRPGAQGKNGPTERARNCDEI